MTALSGLTVLITRPTHQAESLCQMVQAAGGEPWRLPTIDIVPSADTLALQGCANNLDQFDMAIFISVNAVEYAMPALMSVRKTWPKQVAIATVGQKTLNYLTERWQLPVLCGVQPYNTETLLQRPELQPEVLRDQRIVIFRGEGGRELLAETLRQRGATVNYINVYHRVQPLVPEWINERQPDVIVVTSREGLQNLFSMLVGYSWLRRTPFVVMSERVLAEAHILGIQAPIFVSQAACDEGLFEAILKWRSTMAHA